jgi:hypothetical protein
MTPVPEESQDDQSRDDEPQAEAPQTSTSNGDAAQKNVTIANIPEALPEGANVYYAIAKPWTPKGDQGKVDLIRALIYSLLGLSAFLVACITTLLILNKEVSALVAVLSMVIGGLIGLFVDSPTKSDGSGPPGA